MKQLSNSGLHFGESLIQQQARELERRDKLVKELEKELAAAVQDLRFLMDYPDGGCQICKHYRPCKGKECPHYESGVVVKDEEIREFWPDLAWSCEDFNWGECGFLKDTPCNGCNFRSHWQWRGTQNTKEAPTCGESTI